MPYAAIDLMARLPAASPSSSAAYRYGLTTHRGAVAGEASKARATTATPPGDEAIAYALGALVRREMHARGLLRVPPHLRARRRA